MTEDSFTEELLAPGTGIIVVGGDIEWKQQVRALEQTLEKAAHEGMQWKQWHGLQTKVLVELVDVLRRVARYRPARVIPA